MNALKVSVDCVDPDVVPMEYAVIVTWSNGRWWHVMQGRHAQCLTVRKNLLRLIAEASR